MKNGNLYGPFLALLLSAFVAGCGTLRQGSEQAAPMVIAQAPKAPSSGPQEGIQVHGHWVIEVRNPDGTLAERREFENAFVGHQALGLILRRLETVTLWRITIDAVNPGPCRTASGVNTECVIVEPADQSTGSTVFKTLTVGPPDNFNFVQLAGTAEAAINSNIAFVRTDIGFCATSSVQCGNRGFTEKDLTAQPIPVAAGQTIQVTVKISFCCAANQTPPL